MGNIIASNPGSEFWSAANNNLYSDTGKVISTTKPNECNFLSWWDGDLTREILDQTRIVKYELNDGTLSSNRLETFVGVHSNNGTKATPSVSADILGDWREEVIFPTLDDTALRIYTTTIPTEHKLTTFMHDTQYRCAIAWQNIGYNQPPHPSFYVGDDKTDYPKPNVKTAVDSVTVETPEPEQSTETIMSTETFDNADMSEWGGTVVKENAPYNNVLSLSGNTTKELANASTCVKITAEYNDDKTIKNVKSEKVDISEAKPMEVNGNTTVMYWNSLRGMKPVTADSTIELPSIVQLKFMWKPTVNNSSVSLADENGDNIFTIAKPDGAVTYTVNGETKTLDTSLSKNDWYSVTITVDTVSKLIDCAVKDYSSVGIDEKGVYGVSYTGGEVNALKSTGSNYLDNVSFAGIKYNVPMKSVSINVTDGNNAISGAEITVNGKTVKSNSNETATIMLREDSSYNVTVRKAGYKTYSGTISANETSKNITLEVAQENDVYVKYLNTDGEEIADKKLVGKALDNTTYTVSEDNLADIKTADGTIYEFDADATEELTVTVDSETNIELVYKVKNTPVENDLNEFRVNFGKNSIGSSAWSSQVPSEYKTTTKGVNYGLFGNIGSNDITVNLPATLGDSFVIEYDMYVSNIDEGNIFSMVPYSGSTEGNPVGFVNDGSSIALVTGNNASKPTYIADKIYGVGARSGGNTSASSEEIDISEYKGVAIDLNFRTDACADNSSSYVSLLGEKNSTHSVGSSTKGQILTILAKANGNGTWNVITVNGVDIKAKANIHNGTNNGEGDGLSLKRDTTGWLHLYVVPNFEKQKSAVLITRISDGSIVYSGELDFVTQADSFKYVYVSGGKQYNATWLDNIEISGINSSISSLVEA